MCRYSASRESLWAETGFLSLGQIKSFCRAVSISAGTQKARKPESKVLRCCAGLVFPKLWGLFVDVLFAELRASPPHSSPLCQDSSLVGRQSTSLRLKSPAPHRSPVVARRTSSCTGGAAAPGAKSFSRCPGLYGQRERHPNVSGSQATLPGGPHQISDPPPKGSPPRGDWGGGHHPPCVEGGALRLAALGEDCASQRSWEPLVVSLLPI